MIQGLTAAALIGTVAIAGVNPARTHLERSLGVEPSVYTMGDLITLRGAVEARDGERIAAIAGDDAALAHLTGITLAQARDERSVRLLRPENAVPDSL